MLIVVQPELAEHTVFAAVRCDGPRAIAYQHEFARCHQEQDGERRDAAFRLLHERWLEQLGFQLELSNLAAEFRFMSEHASRLVVREATGRGTQSVELFGAVGRYTVGMTLAVATLLDPRAFCYFARHEFMHIDDMLDPGFAYDEAVRPRAAGRSAEALLRDRFAVLWGMSCDARIEASGLLPQAVRPRRIDEFVRAFQFTGDSTALAAFDEVWDAYRRSRPTHRELVDSATRGMAHANDATVRTTSTSPGSPCPLCGFSTFDWADSDRLGAVAAAVSKDFPAWSSELSLCGRCAELYRSRGRSRPHIAASGGRA